jgi:hypothetical protein
MEKTLKSRYFKIAAVMVCTILIGFSACINPREGYKPEQPIKFSHELHAGKNQIACRYCHVGVGEGPNAVIPSANVCMNCHGEVATGAPEVKKLREHWQKGEPIEWVKVHDLPDHARFSHQPHINRGVDCVECHGQVNTMDVVATVKPLNMGWCVNCHRQPQYKAPINCGTCHY